MGKSIACVAGGNRCGYQGFCAQESIMKFDGNLAWKQASAQVTANRDVLIALAGVFLLLPSLALGLLMPQPAPAAGLAPQQLAQMMGIYYLKALPLFIVLLLLQALGTLSMLTLFTDRDRPTVGESIRHGATGIVSYLVAQVVLGFVLAFVALVVVSLSAVSGSKVVVIAVAILVGFAAIYIWARMSLAAPVIAVEGVRNPIAALVRSWKLTAPDVWRLILFYVLVILAFASVITVITMLVGIVIALVASGQSALVTGEIVRSILGTAVSVYLVALLAAVHRQLAGPSVNEQVATFN
jgi:hypothetical protein